MGFWSTTYASPTPRTSAVAAGYTSGLWVHGGSRNADNVVVGTTYVFDVDARAFTTKVTGTAAEQAGGARIGNILWLAGGNTSSGAVNTTRSINLATNAVGATGPTPPVSGWYSMRAASNYTVLLLQGGINSASTTVNVTYSFNGSTYTAKASDVWLSNGAASQLASGGVDQTEFLAGDDGNGAPNASVREYSIAGNTWTGRASLPSATDSPGADVPSGFLNRPVFYGGSKSDGTYNATPYNYNSVSNTWTAMTASTEGGRIWMGFGAPSGRTNMLVADTGLANGSGGFGTGYNYATVYNVDTAPNAPVLGTPAANAAIDATASNTFTWTFSDPDSGDTQSAYALRIVDVAASTTYYWNATTQALTTTLTWNTGTAGSVTLPANVLTNGKTYQWSVATQDTYGPATGPFATAWALTASASPIATVLAPYGTVTGLTTQRVYWNYSQAAGNAQTNYQVKVFTSAVVNGGGFNPATSTAVWDSGVVASAATSVYLQNLADATNYYVFVRAASAGPNWSAWASSAFTTAATTALGTAVRLNETVDYVFAQLTSQVGRPAPDVDTDTNVQNSLQPVIRLALGQTNMTPTGSESGGVVPGEIATGGSLDSRVASIGHTSGTNSYTLTQVWQADGPYTVYLLGVLNNMPYAMAPGQSRYVGGTSNQRRLVFLYRLTNPWICQNADTLTTTVTVTY